MKNCLIFSHFGISKRIYSLIILINIIIDKRTLLIIDKRTLFIIDLIVVNILINTILRVNLFPNTSIIFRTWSIRTLINLLIQFLIWSFIRFWILLNYIYLIILTKFVNFIRFINFIISIKFSKFIGLIIF